MIEKLSVSLMCNSHF